jgi:predicted ATPase
MKIARAVVENFRHIKKLELDFTDSLGRVRDTTLLIGPNTSGKTTILDALAVSVGLSTELSYGRPGFELSPRNIVTKGSLYTKVTCWVRFSPDEVSATRELSEIRKQPGIDTKGFGPIPWPGVPDAEEVELTWTYPDPNNKSTRGFTQCDPWNAGALFKGRVEVARLLATSRIGWDWFKRVGSVFTFDQQRTGMQKTIPREIWEIIHGQSTGDEPSRRERRTSDPKTILLNMAVQSLLPPGSGIQQLDQFKLIQELYAQVCAPHNLVGAIRDESGVPDLVFNDGTYPYRYDGLSSGEQMLLLFLIRMVADNIHQSIVLVDEIELHQHPVWQRKLLYLLPKMGDGNQIIATTHSPYLRDVTPPEAVIELGEVLEPAFAPAD